ncbi:2Fe-2S iron-sulfur cluster binding domain-containing protein [bacterium]|nr:2Fe-2S iron-sulfur cluster binding domain-containing protein [bacterium]
MPKVIFIFDKAKETIEKIIDAETGQNILEIALDNGIGLAHNCGGVCACSTCHVHVLEGMENLSEMTEEEEERLDKAWDLQLNSRLGCQAVVSGNVKVKIP